MMEEKQSTCDGEIRSGALDVTVLVDPEQRHIPECTESGGASPLPALLPYVLGIWFA